MGRLITLKCLPEGLGERQSIPAISEYPPATATEEGEHSPKSERTNKDEGRALSLLLLVATKAASLSDS